MNYYCEMMRRLIYRFCLLPLWVLALWVVPLSAKAEWRQGHELATNVPSASAAIIGNQAYVLSGTVGQGRRAFFETYHIEHDGWQPLTPLPQQIQDFAFAAGAGRIFVIGGRQGNVISAGIWFYAPERGLWVELPDLPETRIGHSAVVVNNHLYVFGGIGGSQQVLRLDLSSNQWETENWQSLAAMPDPGSRMALAVDGELIYLLGGIDEQGQEQNAVRIYNTSTGKWKAGVALPYAVSSAMAGVLSDGLHIVGGFSQKTAKVLAQHRVLQNGKWMRAPELETGKQQSAYVVYRDQLLIFGGALGRPFFSLFTGSDQTHIYEAR